MKVAKKKNQPTPTSKRNRKKAKKHVITSLKSNKLKDKSMQRNISNLVKSISKNYNNNKTKKIEIIKQPSPEKAEKPEDCDSVIVIEDSILVDKDISATNTDVIVINDDSINIDDSDIIYMGKSVLTNSNNNIQQIDLTIPTAENCAIPQENHLSTITDNVQNLNINSGYQNSLSRNNFVPAPIPSLFDFIPLSTGNARCFEAPRTRRSKRNELNINKFGDNIYNAGRVNKTGLRMIVIDGSNVAMGHSNGKYFSVKGLQICIDYFLKRGHKVVAFVPQFRLKHNQSTDSNLLRKLQKDGHVVVTPSRDLDTRRICSYDDRFIVQCAAENGGVIVSSDNFRDLMKENSKWKETIEQRLLIPTWVNDIIMFPQDPLGKLGPNLDEFLKFPNS